jgi:hypothetical protein
MMTASPRGPMASSRSVFDMCQFYVTPIVELTAARGLTRELGAGSWELGAGSWELSSSGQSGLGVWAAEG